jgi:DNA-binding NarL/FixJ family response regulator
MAFQIFIVEDQPILLRAYAFLLHREPDLAVCGVATSGEEALTLIPDLRPHLVLVDLSLPRMNGLTLITYLHQLQPMLPILIVSSHERTVFAAPALFPNVKGYLQKEEVPQFLVPTIRQVLVPGSSR